MLIGLAFILHFGPGGTMYGPLQHANQTTDDDAVLVNIQYLDGHMVVPVALQHADMTAGLSMSLRSWIQQLEHTGCRSNRLAAILAVLRRCNPEDSITSRPLDLGDPDYPLEAEGDQLALPASSSTSSSCTCRLFGCRGDIVCCPFYSGPFAVDGV